MGLRAVGLGATAGLPDRGLEGRRRGKANRKDIHSDVPAQLCWDFWEAGGAV